MALAISTARAPRRNTRPVVLTPPERHLTVVQPATKATISFVATAIFGMFVLIAVVIGFQAFIAQQQLKLDYISKEVRLARIYTDELRQQKNLLISPDYLRTEAAMLGMTQGLGSRFMEIPEDVVAQVLVATGQMDDAIAQAQQTAMANPLAALATLQSPGVAP
jgi:hypothetical protein